VFPGGHLEDGEAAYQAAQRELLEETGFEASAWTYLGGFVVNANQGAAVSHMFHATGCRQIASPQSDDLEASEILLLTRDQLLAAIGRAEIHILTPRRSHAIHAGRSSVQGGPEDPPFTKSPRSVDERLTKR
jgi:ADP-ribose pyrophosphatase